jgi:hypothetical protein
MVAYRINVPIVNIGRVRFKDVPSLANKSGKCLTTGTDALRIADNVIPFLLRSLARQLRPDRR